jgi:hypothetical protein
MVDEQEIDRLLNTPEQDLLMQWHNEQMKRLVGTSADDLVGVLGDLRDAFINWFKRVNIQDTICRQWDYPSKREMYATRLQLTCALADFLASTGGYPAPFVVAVLFVQQFADDICADE